MSGAIQIQQLGRETLKVPIVGTSPLIVHRFDEKAKKMILDAQQGKKVAKQPKDPQADYERSLYRFDDGRYGFPANGFKQAMVGATRFYGSLKMTEIRQVVFVHGEIGNDGVQLVEIDGEPKLREDTVRVGQGKTDLRYRGEFIDWRADLMLTYVTSFMDRSSVVSLLDAAGFGVGVGEWRPERNGDFGTFKVDLTRDIEVLTMEDE